MGQISQAYVDESSARARKVGSIKRRITNQAQPPRIDGFLTQKWKARADTDSLAPLVAAAACHQQGICQNMPINHK
jgi:hypothetical protein